MAETHCSPAARRNTRLRIWRRRRNYCGCSKQLFELTDVRLTDVVPRNRGEVGLRGHVRAQLVRCRCHGAAEHQ
eukprot:362836-Chlamydomonas_euryale.AAC.12